MQIFKLQPENERYRWLAAKHKQDEGLLLALHDGPAGGAWNPIPVEWIEDRLNAGKPKSDFPTLSTNIVFSQKAVDALLDLLVEHGEILPLNAGRERYFLYNATTTLNALDEGGSEIVRFPTGRVLDVTRFAFRAEELDKATIFRLPQLRGRVFVTDTFADRVDAAGLTGFDLQLVWRRDPST